MNLRQGKSLILAVFGVAVAFAQTPDSSGNALLKGSYQFRHVAVQNIDSNYNASEVTATYGTITFDGAGNYSVTATTIDNTINGGAAAPLTGTGTYAIGANGVGYVANPLYIDPTDDYDLIYGAVSQGVFSGSSTEAYGEGYILNDLFVAVPISTVSNSSFSGSYQTGLLDFTGGAATAIKNALFTLSPNGAGGVGSILLNGQASNQSASSVTQTVTGATYTASGNSATFNVPLPSGTSSTNALFTGAKTVVQSADGNFILGWTTGGYDIFFGVKGVPSAATNSVSAGLYFTSALEDSTSYSGVDSFYGGTSGTGDTAGDAIVHARLNFPDYLAYDFGVDDAIQVNSDGSTSADYNGYEYLFGDNGKAFVAIGTDGNYSLTIGLHAATFSGSGVYLNPIGVVNAASYQPITAPLSPGELLTLYGTGLSAVTQTTPGGQAFSTQLGGVSVTIDGTPAPIYYVSPTQMAVVVPYEIATNTSGYANIQVTNNGAASNIVQMYLSDSMPGAFSESANASGNGGPAEGLGYASALHAATGQLITASNPAQPGEYISVYLTGLGTVTPTITDGAVGPSGPLSNSDLNAAGNLTVYFNDYGSNGSTGNTGTIEFAGLAPGLAGLYQINVQVPTSGLFAGDDVELEFTTDFADVNQIYIPYGTTSGSRLARQARHITLASRAAVKRTRGKKALVPQKRREVMVGRSRSRPQ